MKLSVGNEMTNIAEQAIAIAPWAFYQQTYKLEIRIREHRAVGRGTPTLATNSSIVIDDNPVKCTEVRATETKNWDLQVKFNHKKLW